MTDKKEVYLTKEGYEEAKKELDYLINVKRPENIIAIKEARALGDLSENADYDAARNEQAELEDKIKKLQAIIDNGTIIDEISTDKVGVGNTVKISYLDDPDDTDEYKIVGSQEADPFESKISNESPVGKALLGARVGEVVEVQVPDGANKFKVLDIRR